MTYASPLLNQDSVSRSFTTSEMENNRVHKEVVDADLDKNKKLQEDTQKDQEVNYLSEQEALDSEAQKQEQERRENAKHDKILQQKSEHPPAHLGGGDIFDFSA